MRILLIAPLSIDYSIEACLIEPLGLAYVAAAARQAGHEVRLLDQTDRAVRTEAALTSKAIQFAPQVLGVSVTTPCAPVGLRIAREVKAATGCTTVFGGVHATNAATELLQNSAVDYVVRGEGEQTFVDLLDALRDGGGRGDIRGLAYRDADGRSVISPDRPRNEQLDRLAAPLRDTLPYDDYRFYGLLDAIRMGQRVGSVSTSRGCPFSCIFCSPQYTGKPHWVPRAPAAVVDEVAGLVQDRRVTFVFFTDAVFTFSPSRVEAIIDELRSRRMNVSWGCEVRAADMTPPLAARMRAAGCIFAGIGVETGSDEALGRIQKGAHLSDMLRGTRALADADIQIHGNVIIGFPWEDRRYVEECITFYRSLPMDILGISYAVPFPGTPLHRQAVGEDLVFDWDYQHWTTRRPVMRTRHLDAGELMAFYQKATRAFYLRPGYGLLAARRLARRPGRALTYAVTAYDGFRQGRWSRGWR